MEDKLKFSNINYICQGKNATIICKNVKNVAMSDVKIRLGVIVGPNAAKFALMIGESRRTIDNYLKGGMPCGEFLKKRQKGQISVLIGF